ncbi:hypothetical protein HPB51_000685 [Rhipicephalus microplus]|uniref:Uncharacterized protein n=1 Tax=Rhipicephalus microplus TaxID=6941 RepID=A0A9J6EQ37_RHIMP|nr:hypothetical protein HPB51_000685 [Rhipicephalus microplus]
MKNAASCETSCDLQDTPSNESMNAHCGLGSSLGFVCLKIGSHIKRDFGAQENVVGTRVDLSGAHEMKRRKYLIPKILMHIIGYGGIILSNGIIHHHDLQRATASAQKALVAPDNSEFYPLPPHGSPCRKRHRLPLRIPLHKIHLCICVVLDVLPSRWLPVPSNADGEKKHARLDGSRAD